MNTIVWEPSSPENTHITRFMRKIEQQHGEQLPDYAALYTWSIQHPTIFWQTLCDYFALTFNTPPTHILQTGAHLMDARWFEGATFNFAEKLLSREDDHPALICLNEQGIRDEISYRTLKQHVLQCAEGLKHAGIQTGDRVAAILPNGSHAIIAMLATATLGAIWSSCSPDFGAEAIIDRLSQIQPSVLFISNGYTYNGKTYRMDDKLSTLVSALSSIKHYVICPTLHDVSISTPPHTTCLAWEAFLRPSSTQQFTAFPFAQPLYLLFSSGTTGQPKCILHGAGGTLLQHLKELGLHTNLTASERLFFYTTCGWMMWNWMVSALALGSTLILYDGAPTYPQADHLFEILQNEQVHVFGTSAKFLSSIEHAGVHPNTRYPLESLRCILSTGSPLLSNQYDFVHDHIKHPLQLSSISGGTDIISCFALGNPISPVYRGELQCIGLGMDVNIFNEHGQSVQNTLGELVCTQAFPSMPLRFWNDPLRHKYQHAYFDLFPNWINHPRAFRCHIKSRRCSHRND